MTLTSTATAVMSCETESGVIGTAPGFSPNLFAFPLLLIIPPLLHTHLSPPVEFCDSYEQAAYYHIVDLHLWYSMNREDTSRKRGDRDTVCGPAVSRPRPNHQRGSSGFGWSKRYLEMGCSREQWQEEFYFLSGNLRPRWEDNIRVGIRELRNVSEVWIQISQNNLRRLVFVKTVMQISMTYFVPSKIINQ
jgi:hypothetical protein